MAPAYFNPFTHGRGALYAPPSLFLCPLLKISRGNPYLKILDTANRDEDPDPVGSVDFCPARLNKFKHKTMVYNIEYYACLPKI